MRVGASHDVCHLLIQVPHILRVFVCVQLHILIPVSDLVDSLDKRRRRAPNNFDQTVLFVSINDLMDRNLLLNNASDVSVSFNLIF
jgi:hypothetical protein